MVFDSGLSIAFIVCLMSCFLLSYVIKFLSSCILFLTLSKFFLLMYASPDVYHIKTCLLGDLELTRHQSIRCVVLFDYTT